MKEKKVLVEEEEMRTSLSEKEARAVYGDSLPEIPEFIGVVNEEDFLKEDDKNEQE